ncbi:hypothetical protein SAMN04487769_0438 [Burkholderia sp. b14]|nr:hypothetical protein SAMN04487769_0438 [Burkholderia sp. b14]
MKKIKRFSNALKAEAVKLVKVRVVSLTQERPRLGRAYVHPTQMVPGVAKLRMAVHLNVGQVVRRCCPPPRFCKQPVSSRVSQYDFA